MAGVVTWIVSGMAAGYFMSLAISGREKCLLLLTLIVGIAGAVVGGFVAQVFGQGTSASFSLYAVPFAAVGAVLSLVTYRRLIGA
jgi:uncharacterized membrane protein YeaQ/YmgE (transglycosylase-associated protein family)